MFLGLLSFGATVDSRKEIQSSTNSCDSLLNGASRYAEGTKQMYARQLAPATNVLVSTIQAFLYSILGHRCNVF